jgi:predicted  nucleic acid-binding Zn-ribbon protein
MHGQTTESDAMQFSRSFEIDETDQLDKAGQTILQLVERAAGVAEENSRHVLDTVQKLSHQLHEAENRIADLEAEVTAYRERADRAEQWMHRVYTEIETNFLSKALSGSA